MRVLRKLGRDSKGAVAVEYGLILALVFLAMIGGIRAFAQSAVGMWDYVKTEVSGR